MSHGNHFELQLSCEDTAGTNNGTVLGMPLCEESRIPFTMQMHNIHNNGFNNTSKASHMDGNMQIIRSSELESGRLTPSTEGSQASSDSLDSSYSASTNFTKPSLPVSIPSLDSGFDSTPSLPLSFVNSTETLNYRGTRPRMSVPVMPAGHPNAEDYARNMASRGKLESLTTAHPLPEQALGRWHERWRKLRYGTMSAYMRLWTLAILTNVAVIIAMVCKVTSQPGTFTYADSATATGANLLVSALMRHEHFVNLLFRLATAIPHGTPMAIRRQAAKVYNYGGLHSGCGISALLWYILYTLLATIQFKGSRTESVALAATTALALLCMCIIIGMAHPKIRARWHDQWEISHRFCGWTAIGLVWAQTLVIVLSEARHAHQPTSQVLVKTPTFWFLVIITCCLIYPWLRLRRRKVEAEVLSSHAVRLWFGGKTVPSCVGARLSHRPLTENHGFATIPNAKPTTPDDVESSVTFPEKAHTNDTNDLSRSTSHSPNTGATASSIPNRGEGFSILVSRAGDFTSNLITNPPTHIYTRGAPTRGVLHIAHLFRPLIVVATGSGIGPCLSFLQVYPDYPMRVIWSARAPIRTYGREVVDAVLRADRRAVLIDTEVLKKDGEGGPPAPNLSAVSWALAKEVGAEAVVIISNPPTTRKVVFALETRGFPAFGAIFDS